MKNTPAHLTRANEEVCNSRIRIEQVLQAARQPLSAFTVSELAGVPISTVRTHLTNAVNRGRAHNLNPGMRGRSLYAWGQDPSVEAVNVTIRQTTWRTSVYVGEPAIALRPGSARAFELPSRMGSELHPYRTSVRESV